MDYNYEYEDIKTKQLINELSNIVNRIENNNQEQRNNFFVTIPAFAWDRIKHLIDLLEKLI